LAAAAEKDEREERNLSPFWKTLIITFISLLVSVVLVVVASYVVLRRGRKYWR
jgi:ABC-type spermidine/putrescine transport system permease subunit II